MRGQITAAQTAPASLPAPATQRAVSDSLSHVYLLVTGHSLSGVHLA